MLESLPMGKFENDFALNNVVRIFYESQGNVWDQLKYLK